MTAAAVGTCAWAEGEAGGEGDSTPEITYLNEGFGENWTLTGNLWWSYSAEEVADGELVAGDALSLNTGSKVLTGSFASDKNPVAIGTDGLYFKSKVTFKDPSDTLPTLGAQDKFALVVLDNVESCETYNTEENPVVTPATNLWVIAKYGDGVGVKRAYKLKIPLTGKQPEQDENGGDVLTNLDKAWLDVPHEIVVKAYGNVMADSQTPRAGFMVMVDGYICTVDCSCAIEGEGAGVINPTQAGTPVYAGDVYLGFAKDAINGTLNPRYNKNQLLLSMTDNNAELTSVDFQGQGVIDNVSLATTGADFGPDATVLTFVGYDATKIASITVGGEAAVNGVYTITGSETADEEGTVAIIVTVNDGYVLKGEGWTKNGLTYTYAGYTLPTASAEIALNVFAPAAYVGDEAYETVKAALDAIAKNGGTGTVVLKNNVTLYDDDVDGNGLTISAGEITIDLNGKTIQAGVNEEDSSTCSTIGVSGGKLIVKDSIGGGAILAAAEEYYAIDASAGLTEIQAGTIGKINGSAEILTLVGGSYTDATVKVDDEDKFAYAGSVADGFDATLTDGVWTVAEKVIVKYTVSATYDNTQVSVTYLTTGEVEENTVLSFSVEPLTGFENVVVKAGNTELTLDENGKYTWKVVADVTITITATAIVTGPTIDDTEGKITVDETSGNATIETTNAMVTVTGTVSGDVIVTPSVGTVKVTLAQGKTVKVYFEGQNITDAFTVSSANGTTTIVLNEEGWVDGVPVKPVMAEQTALPEGMTAPFEAGTDVAVGVKTIPGLKYQLIRSDAPNGTFGDVDGASATGTGAPVKLEDKNKPSGKAFYKVKVSQR